MKQEIFADLIKSQEKTKKWLFIPVSLTFHFLLVAAIVISPLLNADAVLPPIKTVEVIVVGPNDLAMPIARGGGGKARAKAREKKDEPQKVKKVVSTDFIAPMNIPDEIPEEEVMDYDFGDSGYGDGDYVIGAIEGDPNGVPGGQLFKTQTNKPIPAVRVEQTPRVIRKVRPVYPPVALRARIEGTVIIEAVTDIYGNVKSTKVVKGHPLLTQAALDAVRKWVYEPYIINGVAKPVRFVVELSFTINSQ